MAGDRGALAGQRRVSEFEPDGPLPGHALGAWLRPVPHPHRHLQQARAAGGTGPGGGLPHRFVIGMAVAGPGREHHIVLPQRLAEPAGQTGDIRGKLPVRVAESLDAGGQPQRPQAFAALSAASRRQRIATGSGVSVSDVNDLVNRFFEARKMMKQMAGQFGFGGGGRSATKKVPKNPRKARQAKKGRRSGNPANRAAAGAPDLSNLPPSLQQLPPGLGNLDQLPPGFDPSKLNFGKKK